MLSNLIKNKIRGFTLVELLVVVGIIGILASFILSNLSNVRTKGLDARKQLEINSINNALFLFYDKFNRMPYNYNLYTGGVSRLCTDLNGGSIPCSGAYTPNTGACESKVNDAPGASDTVGTDLRNINPAAFNKSMQELVDAGFLPDIPKSPGGSGYCYYNTGARNQFGAIIMTDLDASVPSVDGLPASCRQTGMGWCDKVSSHQYCRCNPY